MFGEHGAQDGTAGSQHVHGVCVRRDALQDVLNRCRQAAQCLELAFVSRQFGDGGQPAVHQEIGDFFELGFLREIQDVVTAIVKVVAGAADRA